MQRLVSDAPAGEETLALWREYEGDGTPEVLLVHDADRLEMIFQAREYELAGNQSLDDFWEAVTWNYSASQRIFDELTDERRNRR